MREEVLRKIRLAGYTGNTDEALFASTARSLRLHVRLGELKSMILFGLLVTEKVQVYNLKPPSFDIYFHILLP